MATAETARRLDDAFNAYAREQGDGFRDHDWLGAKDYREEGFRLGEEAADMPQEDRDDWLDGQVYAFPASAADLIWIAARFRLAELVAADDRYPFRTDWLALAGEITTATVTA